MDDIREILLPIQDKVEGLERFMSEELASSVGFVEKVVEYVINNGGKRLRPILAILSAHLTGYSGDASIKLGAAIEFMHTASLLHDDVIDNAAIRRGRASINSKWGNHVSVLVGDFLYCRAMDVLVRHGDLKVLRVVTDAMTLTTEGEILEILKSNDLKINEDDYLRIVHGKTAALIGAACQTGAILGRVSEEFEQSLRKFGLNIGIAFQLMDDVLDYMVPSELLGKTNGTDLREGKLTLPLIMILRRCDDAERDIITNALIADDLNPELLKQVKTLLDKYDGIRMTQKLAETYIEKARHNLKPFKPSLVKDTLLAMADYVLTRRN